MKNPAILAAALACSVAVAAFAHGSAAHEGHEKKSAAVQKEQKPWGIAGDAKAVTKTINIVMSDTMRFTPNLIEVKQGDVVKFVVGNGGKLLHEMVIGTKADLEQHAAMMAKHPGMEHDEPYMAHVSPGKKASLVWNFNRAGEFDFACLVPGHYEAGMTGKIRVVPVVTQPLGDFTAAEVRKVDRKARKITLNHEEIKNLGMPPMAMVFQVKDAALLGKYKAGDKVQFKAIYEGGKYVLVDIRPG